MSAPPRKDEFARTGAWSGVSETGLRVQARWLHGRPPFQSLQNSRISECGMPSQLRYRVALLMIHYTARNVSVESGWLIYVLEIMHI